MRYKSFKQLPKIKKKNKFYGQSQTKEEAQDQKNSINEEELFHQAMQDVSPLQDKGKGRRIILQHPGPWSKKSREDHQSGHQYLYDLVQGKAEFEIELTNEYLQGNIRGLDPRIFRKLKAGHYSPEAHLDLHGLNAEEAQNKLIFFIRDNYLSGKRCLLLIPGRGKNSPQGIGILREHLQKWLTQYPLKRVVLAFSTAQNQHGGAGAIYVLLRKYKKTRGKIFWDRYRIEGEP